jgi:hypothetical protein
VDDARRRLHVVDRRQRILRGLQRREQMPERQNAAVIMNLERSDARRNFDNSGER